MSFSENITSTSSYLFLNESIQAESCDVNYLCPYTQAYPGILILTNFRLIFKTDKKQNNILAKTALGNVIQVEKIGSFSSRGDNSYGIEVICKDFRNLRFSFKPEMHSRKLFFEKLQLLAFPLSNNLPLWAFNFHEVCSTNGHEVYDAEAEYKRLNIPDESWRLSRINKDYAFSDTYPALFCVPKSVKDEDLKNIGNFRSKSRIPVLAWKHPTTDAVILRSSQPMVGLANRRNSNDEALILAAQENNALSHKFIIFDARPNVNAVANKAKGGGYESEEYYPETEIEFLDIHNIHVMRESSRKLKEECFPSIDENHWLTKLESTQWLEHIKCILLGAYKVVDRIENQQASVLVHCSDGWDRTTQLTSLAMLMLDAHYRTLKGFQVLVEKEWCSFGHKFNHRYCHGEEKATSVERSPIFVQFIDCVWQLTSQFPACFQFNEYFLLAILKHLYSCFYGTFYGNCEKQRVEEGVKERTLSLWSYINAKPTDYLNPFYNDYTKVNAVLFPLVGQRHLKFWSQYYLKHNPCTFTNYLNRLRTTELLLAKKKLEDHLNELKLEYEKNHTNTEKEKNPQKSTLTITIH